MPLPPPGSSDKFSSIVVMSRVDIRKSLAAPTGGRRGLHEPALEAHSREAVGTGRLIAGRQQTPSFHRNASPKAEFRQEGC